MFPSSLQLNLCRGVNVGRRMRGIGLPASIFIILILALLVLAISQLSQTSSRALGQNLQSQKAFYAAESGAQVALNRIFAGGASCDGNLADIDFNAGGANLGFASCTATLSCSQVAVAGNSYMTVTSTGRCGDGFEAAQRQVQVRARSN